jgi:uncharacterized protein (DUF2141 family)
VAPGGGKRDTTPPKVLSYMPDSASLNFKSKYIEITFDEFIQLRELNNQLIISPPMENAPDIKVKSKTLYINIDKKEQLKPNTTYVINLGNALQDIHESNAKENFKYIFSTGSFIDSLIVKGKVENAFDHKTEKGILVMLYSDFNDSTIYKKKPDYFAKTTDDGSFQINNVRDGKYKLLALKDANANYKYDAETERIGFVDSLIRPVESDERKPSIIISQGDLDLAKMASKDTLGKSKKIAVESKKIEPKKTNKNILIEMFQEPPKKLFLKKSIYNSFGKIVFVYNKPADSIHIQPINYKFNDGDVLLDYSKNKDTLNYWFKNIDKESLILQVSNGNKIMDTVEFKLIKKEDALKSRKNPLKLFLLNSPGGNQNFDLNAGVKLFFNNPIAKWNEQPIQFKEDSLSWSKKSKKLSYDVNFQSVSLLSLDYAHIVDVKSEQGKTTSVPEQSLLTTWKENTKYHLFIPPGTFTDFFGLTNDTLKIDFKTREENYYGTLKLNISIPETKGRYIVQLIDEREIVVRENIIKKTETLNYSYLYPQKYKLKIIYDTNSNNKWDTGNLLQKQQPEKIIFDTAPVNVRSNWDMELDWKVGE